MSELTYQPCNTATATPSAGPLVRAVPLEEFPYERRTPYCWIAPNGDFYPANHCAHWDCAAILAPYFYPKTMSHDDVDPMDVLERFGWLKMGLSFRHRCGAFMMWCERHDGPNDAQYETAKRLIDYVRPHDARFAGVLEMTLMDVVLGRDC